MLFDRRRIFLCKILAKCRAVINADFQILRVNVALVLIESALFTYSTSEEITCYFREGIKVQFALNSIIISLHRSTVSCRLGFTQNEHVRRVQGELSTAVQKYCGLLRSERCSSFDRDKSVKLKCILVAHT